MAHSSLPTAHTVGAVEEWLRAKVDGMAPSRAELAELSGSGWVKSLAKSVLANSADVARVAARSFYHPTGGYKLVLASVGYDRPELRLHIWPHGNRFEEEHNAYSIHDHKWDFVSSVLAGLFLEELFEENAQGQLRARKYRFGSAVRGQEYKTEYVGEVTLQNTFTAPLARDATYYQASRQLHHFEPIDESLSCTVFLRGLYLRDETTVCVPIGRTVIEDSSGPRRLSADETVELLELVASG